MFTTYIVLPKKLRRLAQISTHALKHGRPAFFDHGLGGKVNFLMTGVGYSNARGTLVITRRTDQLIRMTAVTSWMKNVG